MIRTVFRLTGQAGHHRRDLKNRDRRRILKRGVDIPEFRDVLLDRIAQMHPALFDELQQRQRRELFRDRADAIRRVVRGDAFGFSVRVAVMLAPNQFAGRDNTDRHSANAVFRKIRTDLRVELAERRVERRRRLN